MSRKTIGKLALFGLLTAAAFAQKPHRGVSTPEKKQVKKNEDCMCISILRDVTEPFTEGRGGITINGVWGFIDRSGRVMIPPQFESISRFSEGVASAVDREKHLEGYINSLGKWAIEPQFSAAFSFVNGIAAIGDTQGTFGIDHNGKRVIQPRADIRLDGRVVFDGPALRVAKKTLYQRRNSSGELLTSFSAATRTDALTDYPLSIILREQGEGLFPASSGLGENRTGYIDFIGKWVIVPQFQEARKFIDGHAIAEKNDKYGVIDRNGAWVVQPEWISIGVDSNGWYSLRSSADLAGPDAMGWFERHTEWKQQKTAFKVIAPGVRGLRNVGTTYTEDFFDLVNESGESLLQKTWAATFGEQVMPSHFIAERVTLPTAAHTAILLTYKADKYGKPTKTDEEAQEDNYTLFFPAEQKLLHDHWTAMYSSISTIDLQGRNSGDGEVGKIPETLLFRDTGEMLTAKGDIGFFKGDWSTGMAGFAYISAKDDGSGNDYALIDREGKRLLSDNFRDPEGFSEGVATVCNDQTSYCGVVDKQGHIVVPFEFDRVGRFVKGYAIAEKQGKTVILSSSGETFTWPDEYDDIGRLEGDSGLLLVSKGDKRGIARGDGKVILPPIYQGIESLEGGLFIIHLGADPLYGVAAADGTVLQKPAFYSVERISYQSKSGFMTAQKIVNGDKAILGRDGHLLTDFDVKEIEDGPPDGPWLLTEHKAKRLLLPNGTLVPLPEDAEEFALLPDSSVLTKSTNVSALADANGNPISSWYRQIDYLGDGLWSGQTALGNEDLFGADGHVQYTMPDDLHALSLLLDPQKKRRQLLALGHGSSSSYVIFDWENGEKRIALPEGATNVTAGDKGLISVELGRECAFVDMDGKVVAKVVASSLQGLHDGRAVAAAVVKDEQNPLYGVVDEHGKWIVLPRYAQFSDSSEGLIWAETPDGEIHLLNQQGRILGRRVNQGNKQVWVSSPLFTGKRGQSH